MKKLSFIVFAVFFIFTSCNNNDEPSQEQESAKIERMHAEIVTLSLSKSTACTNPDEWDFTTFGFNACGEDSFIVYSKKINKTEFLAKIKKYTEARIAFNKKWGMISNCGYSIYPTGVKCEDGKPKLNYNPGLY